MSAPIHNQENPVPVFGCPLGLRSTQPAVLQIHRHKQPTKQKKRLNSPTIYLFTVIPALVLLRRKILYKGRRFLALCVFVTLWIQFDKLLGNGYWISCWVLVEICFVDKLSVYFSHLQCWGFLGFAYFLLFFKFLLRLCLFAEKKWKKQLGSTIKLWS